MNITAPHGSVAPGTIDLTADKPVPLGRLVKVEMRKMLDTRAGLWLMIAIVAITAPDHGHLLLRGQRRRTRRSSTTCGVMATPQGFLLPVLGILLVTQEWSQRTGDGDLHPRAAPRQGDLGEGPGRAGPSG